MHVHVITQGLLFKVNQHSPCNGIGYTEWRGSEVVGSCVGVYTTLKVSVPTQDPHGDEISLLYCCDYCIRQWSTVPYTCHTSISYQVESVEGGEGERGGGGGGSGGRSVKREREVRKRVEGR